MWPSRLSHRCAHHERGHQVLEHGARPGDERGTAADRRQRAAQPEPVGRVDIALGDGEEAGQASLGRQEVVAVRIEAPVPDPVADGEELPRGHEEEAGSPSPGRVAGPPRRCPGAIARASLPSVRHHQDAGRSGPATGAAWGRPRAAGRPNRRAGRCRDLWLRDGRGDLGADEVTARHDRLEVPGVAGNRPLRGFRPGHQLALCSPCAVRHEGPSDVSECPGLCREQGQRVRPTPRASSERTAVTPRMARGHRRDLGG